MIDVEQLVLQTAVASRKVLLKWAKTADETVENANKMEESLNKIVEMSDEVCNENDTLRAQVKNFKRFVYLSCVDVSRRNDAQMDLMAAFSRFVHTEQARINSPEFIEMMTFLKTLPANWVIDD